MLCKLPKCFTLGRAGCLKAGRWCCVCDKEAEYTRKRLKQAVEGKSDNLSTFTCFACIVTLRIGLSVWYKQMGYEGFLVLGVAEKNMNKCTGSGNGKELPLKSNAGSIFDNSSLLDRVGLYIYANVF